MRGLRKEKDTRASYTLGINMFVAALFKGDRPLLFACLLACFFFVFCAFVLRCLWYDIDIEHYYLITCMHRSRSSFEASNSSTINKHRKKNFNHSEQLLHQVLSCGFQNSYITAFSKRHLLEGLGTEQIHLARC